MIEKNFKLIEVRLFGSRARGNHQLWSDTDILKIVDSSVPCGDPAEDVPSLLIEPAPGTDISTYSANRISDMYRAGHLFAWHLFYESIPIWSATEESFIQGLGEPSNYLQHLADSNEFVQMSTEVLESLTKLQGNPTYELGIMYVCMRNIALIASTRCSKKPLFGPSAPFELDATAPKFPLSKEQYDLSMRCRHAVTRDVTPPPVDREGAISIACTGEKWIREMAQWIKEN